MRVRATIKVGAAFVLKSYIAVHETSLLSRLTEQIKQHFVLSTRWRPSPRISMLVTVAHDLRRNVWETGQH